jgi:hypothetical protein
VPWLRFGPKRFRPKAIWLKKKTVEDREALARYLEKRGRPGDMETAAAMGFGSARR